MTTDTDTEVLVLPAELTIYQARALAAQLLDALAQGVTALDLSAVTEIDTAGWQVLMSARRSAEAEHRALRFERASPAVVDVFTTLGSAELLAPADAAAGAGS